MCRAFESHQACQKTASQSTVFDCGACFLLSALRGERTGASRIASGVPRRNELRSFRFFVSQNRPPLHCSSFSAKGRARLTCSVVNALATACCRCQPFAGCAGFKPTYHNGKDILFVYKLPKILLEVVATT